MFSLWTKRSIATSRRATARDVGCAQQAMASEQYSSPEQVIFVGRSGRSVDEIQLPESNQRRNVCQQHFVPILVPRSRKRDHRKTVQYCSAARPFPIYIGEIIAAANEASHAIPIRRRRVSYGCRHWRLLPSRDWYFHPCGDDLKSGHGALLRQYRFTTR